MTEDRNGKTYSFDVCSTCELICCRDANPPLTLGRKQILNEYIKDQNIPVANPFDDGEYSHPSADGNGFCVFYNKGTGKCQVHLVKPETCRAGPITFDINLKTCKVEFYLKKARLCAFAGILYKDKAGLAQHLEVAKKEILQVLRELDADALKAILIIPEPQTFKIDEDELPKEVINKLHAL
jgi:uncharacterized protein